MDFKTFFFKKIFMGFFVVTTCICAAIAVIGLLFDPEARFGYQGLFTPLIYGALTMLPSLVTYSKYELSIRKMLIRKLLEFALIEIIVFLIINSGGLLTSPSLVISLSMSVLLIYLTANLVLWVGDRKTARAFNNALLEMQQNYENEL